MTIEYKKSFSDGTCFEVKIDERISIDEFIKIEELFDELYKKKCSAENEIQERRSEKQRLELEEKIKENPCYLCMKEICCKEPCKGKKTCNKYEEYPFK